MINELENNKILKKSYTITCSSDFRDRVLDLTLQKLINVGDLARSILIVIPENIINTFEDPGEPEFDDREKTIIKSGRSKGRPWSRKPRLQARLSPGYNVILIRRALNLALILSHGEHVITIKDSIMIDEDQRIRNQKNTIELAYNKLEDKLKLRSKAFSLLLFEPLIHGIHTRQDALYIMGLPPSARPDLATLKGRYRELATIYHPDGELGNHDHMSQLNAAMDFLSK
tara:strand:- start:36 stop:722 length:687 start_codon:yes stop_codon:yes gene_type:complete